MIGTTEKRPYTYRVRPGYGSQNLLIEFMGDCDDEEFKSALHAVLETIGIRVINIMDLWMNDEVVYQMRAGCGEFDLSFHTWGDAFIHAEKNQPAIAWLDEQLRASGKFEKEEVDFALYRLQPEDPVDQDGTPNSPPPSTAAAASSSRRPWRRALQWVRIVAGFFRSWR